MEKVKIYTDGCCVGNGKFDSRGGWAYLIFNKDKAVINYGSGKIGTTNNKMELNGIIKALEYLDENGLNFNIDIYTDSMYIVNCFRKNWYSKWRKNGWINSNGDPVKNKDLWERLLEFYEKWNINYYHVKGHNGNRYNEICDLFSSEVCELDDFETKHDWIPKGEMEQFIVDKLNEDGRNYF